MKEMKEAKRFASPESFFKEDDTLFYYKRFDKEFFGMEIVFENLARKVGINCAHYEIMKNGKDFFYVSRDIGGNGYFFTAGDFGITNVDSLDDIKTKILKNFNSNRLIEDLYKVYFFDILLMNSDRSSGNYGIRASEDDAQLFILDNEYALELFSDVILYYVDQNNSGNDLEYFLMGNPSYREIFYEMYKTLTPNLLKEEFEKLESKYGRRIVKKNLLLKKYIDNYERIASILISKENILRFKR